MKFIADLHIHSHYSRATSKNLNFEQLTKWAQLKGVHVVGTGDISHPGWLQEMKDKLEPAEEGLYRLKDEYAQVIQEEVPKACQTPVRFMLAGEISSIYKKKDKVRKIHNVIFAPTLEAVEKIQAALEKIGNIRSDGRPILGLPSRDLLEIILEVDPACYLIPAHIWTPWFSLLGSKSGYDSVEECFEDLTPHIFALETGLSSDPPMNWRVSALDRYTLVSNSDAHSPQKLAREANLFDTELSYPAIFEALQTGSSETFLGTLEFFPEEGKYHFDGHRKCGIRWEPKTTIAHNGLCAECGKPVTVGVTHRIETLADRPEGAQPTRTLPFHSLIPLPEILSEVHRVGPNSKRVKQNYEALLAKLCPELSILLDVPLAEIEQAGGSLLAEGIRRMRRNEVTIAAGYDGEFGVIKLFEEEERDTLAGQLSLFAPPQKKQNQKDRGQPAPEAAPAGEAQTPAQWSQSRLFNQPVLEQTQAYQPTPVSGAKIPLLAGLNPQQQEAVLSTDVPLVIVAGPGTGKTRTLTYRIAHLITERGVSPEGVLAITFTNKAAGEMATRLTRLLGAEMAGQIVIKTFHAFGAMILRENGQPLGSSQTFSICSDDERQAILKQCYPDMKSSDLNTWLEQISAAKNQLQWLDAPELSDEFAEIYDSYEAVLNQKQVLDFDDLIVRTVRLFESQPDILQKYQTRFRWISVDEYQDVNFAQYRLLRLLTGPETNLCVIGDPDQAIYGFRGASREYFLQFEQDFPMAKTIHLNQSYRSTQLILDASGQVIEKESTGERVKIWSEFVDKTRLEVYQAPTDKAEAEYVVHQIEKMIGGLSYFSIDSERVSGDDDHSGRTFADFAVLYRLGAQSQPLIEAFHRSGIPYQTVGQTPLAAHKEIKTILACLWLLHQPDSTFHLEQVASKKQLPNVEVFLGELRNKVTTQSVSISIEQIYQFLADHTGFRIDDKSDDRIQQLMLRAAPFENRLEAFLEEVMLQKETDIYDPRADRVTLMTLHASKGLEFPVVFIVGCEENLLPYQRDGKSFDLDEERRLFYVGMTRAQQKLILTHAKSRFLFGQRYEPKPSRFIDDIENALKERKKMASRKPAAKEQDNLQLKLF
jgi:DNA helicase-2/ATP-dependent DNA helicase PcrA